MNDLSSAAPQYSMVFDKEKGREVIDPKEAPLVEDFYKKIKDNVVNNIYAIGINVNKITHPELKNMMRARFMRYMPVPRILNKDNFAVKLQKAQVKLTDVYFK
jgi:hypothetical protein